MADDPKQSPPYVSYVSFWNSLDSFKEKGIPPQIDRTTLTNFNGSMQTQLLGAYKFFDLIDESGRPSDKFSEIVNAEDIERASILLRLVRTHMPRQFELLTNGTFQLLASAYDEYSIKQSTKIKCIQFLIKAAKKAGKPISQHIEQGLKSASRMTSTNKPPKKTKQGQSKTPAPAPDNGGLEEGTGKKVLTIQVGVDKQWMLQIDEEYDESDVRLFLLFVEKILLKELEE